LVCEKCAESRREQYLAADTPNPEGKAMARRARGTITEKGPGKWLVRAYAGTDAGGKRRYVSEVVEGGITDAEKVRTRLLGERDGGRLSVRPRTTLNDYLDAWLETTAKPSVRARTLEDYTATLQRYVRPHLGDVRVSRLTPVTVRAMLVKLREQGLSPRTVRKAHEVLRNALEQAVSDGFMASNPARDRKVRKALPQKEQKEPITVRKEDVRAFLDAAAGERLHALWMLLLLSGLRPSEALALRWSDVNGDTVRVTRVLVDKAGLPLHFEKPKSKTSRRAVVIPDVVVKALVRHRKQQAQERLIAGGVWEHGNLIFCDEIGQPMKQDHVRHHFGKLAKAAELPEGITVYSLRHSCATLLLEAGVPLKIVSERLGHSTVMLTGDVYAHVNRSMQEQAADVLAGVVQAGRG
jgi:integrase